jgi:hypothetical protein
LFGIALGNIVFKVKKEEKKKKVLSEIFTKQTNFLFGTAFLALKVLFKLSNTITNKLLDVHNITLRDVI